MWISPQGNHLGLNVLKNEKASNTHSYISENKHEYNITNAQMLTQIHNKR